MDLKSKIDIIKKGILVIILSSPFCFSAGQQTPINSISYWVFNPFIYNPAIAGCKDFISMGINAAFEGKSNSQILTGNTRISKTNSGYFASPDIMEFKNYGLGGSIYNDFTGVSRNIGASVAGSYQIPMNRKKLSFLSFGGSVKIVDNMIDTSSSENNSPLKKTLYANVDAGIYYYSPSLFIGISATDLLGNPGSPDSLGLYEIAVSRNYFFTAGYKILLSRSLNTVFEPSILIKADDSTINEFQKNINLIFKLYLENVCIGSSFHIDDSNTSFFFQYRYPRIYVGAYYELPKKTPYFKKSPLIEFTLGINIQKDKSRFSMHPRW